MPETRRRLSGEVKVELDEETFTVELDELQLDLKIDKINLVDELEDQPGRFGWVASLSAQADYDLGKSKQYLASLRATLGKTIRAEDTGKKRGEKLTNDGVEEVISTDPLVLEAFDDYLEKARISGILAGFREAFRQRSQMLQSLAMLSRAEYKYSE